MGDTTGIVVWTQISMSFKLIFSQNISTKDSPCKISHIKCFKTTNFDRFHCHKFIAICRSLFISYDGMPIYEGVVIVQVRETAFDIWFGTN